MKLHAFSVTNYRSIENLTAAKIIDPEITCFIGENGSGKSNILKALAAVKDTSLIKDSDFHARTEQQTEVAIYAKFLFGREDEELLGELGLNNDRIQGFEIKVLKKLGFNPETTFTLIGEVLDGAGLPNKLETLKILREFLSNTSIQAEPDNPSFKERLLAKFSELQLGSGTPEEIIKELNSFFAPVRPQNQEVAAEIDKAISSIGRDMGAILMDLFTRLSIELLELNNYPIENSAPITELKNRENHPFLFDLLVLSGRTANDFEKATGTRKSIIRETASNQLSEKIKSVWPNHTLDFMIDKDQGDQILTFSVRTPQKQPINLEDLSEGEKWFLRFYTRLAIAEKAGQQIIWLFDEPGSYLHAESQVNLKRFFEEIAKTSQIVYTTHQPMMIPWDRLERIFVVSNVNDESELGTKVHRRFWIDDRFRSPLREAMGLFVGEEFLTGRKHVIVEGISDYFYLRGWLRYFQNTSDAKIWNQFSESMIPVGGIDKIPLYLLFLGRETSNQVNWVVVVDFDSKLKDLHDKLASSGLSEWASKTKTIRELSGTQKQGEIDIEDLFKTDEYLREFRDFYASAYPTVQMPDEKDLAAIKVDGKIAKQLEKLLVAKNPGLTPNGHKLRLDKTGIAQSIYSKLINSKRSVFSRETEAAFKDVLKEINKMFDAVKQDTVADS